jgi:hypothetical protein
MNIVSMLRVKLNHKLKIIWPQNMPDEARKNIRSTPGNMIEKRGFLSIFLRKY